MNLAEFVPVDRLDGIEDIEDHSLLQLGLRNLLPKQEFY